MSASNINGAAGISFSQMQGMDIESMLMAVQSNRANLLEAQLMGEMKNVQAKNEQIAALNARLTVLTGASQMAYASAAATPETGLSQAQKDALATLNVAAKTELTANQKQAIADKWLVDNPATYVSQYTTAACAATDAQDRTAYDLERQTSARAAGEAGADRLAVSRGTDNVAAMRASLVDKWYADHPATFISKYTYDEMYNVDKGGGIEQFDEDSAKIQANEADRAAFEQPRSRAANTYADTEMLKAKSGVSRTDPEVTRFAQQWLASNPGQFQTKYSAEWAAAPAIGGIDGAADEMERLRDLDESDRAAFNQTQQGLAIDAGQAAVAVQRKLGGPVANRAQDVTTLTNQWLVNNPSSFTSRYAGLDTTARNAFNQSRQSAANSAGQAAANAITTENANNRSNGKTITTKGELDKAVTELKAQVDSLGSTQQMDMLRLQSLSNKRNEAFDLMTNFMKKFADKRDAIIGNMR
jgi:hypothetical protein